MLELQPWLTVTRRGMTYYEVVSTVAAAGSGVASLGGCTLPVLLPSGGMFAFFIRSVASPGSQVK